MADTRPREERHDQLRFQPGAMPPMFGDTAAALIVDDDPVVAALLADVLEPEGYQCSVANSAADARSLLAEYPYAVALVDVMMPGETGLELVDDLRGKYEDLAVVMVTGVDDPHIAELALESGATGYVVKPFSANQVVITVNNSESHALPGDRAPGAAGAPRADPGRPHRRPRGCHQPTRRGHAAIRRGAPRRPAALESRQPLSAQTPAHLDPELRCDAAGSAQPERPQATPAHRPLRVSRRRGRSSA